MSQLDHILITTNLLSAMHSVEHVMVGRNVSDHLAVVLYLDWSHSNNGKGVFLCGANTHKDPKYQKSVRLALVKALCDYIDEEAIANSLRQLIGQIEDREEILSIDDKHFNFPSLKN